VSTFWRKDHNEPDRPGTGPTDAELVRQALDGEASAFDSLVIRYERRAASTAYRLLGNSHDAQEVCQDAFLRAYQSLGSLQKPARFGAWLLRIVSNLSLNFRRSRGSPAKQATLPIDDVLAGVSGTRVRASAARGEVGAGNPEGGEVAEAIERAIAELPERQRMALVLFAIEGWPQRDVAEVLNCSLEAVKWNVFQARKVLRAKLAEYL
jgi:RNA polymerase sigma-70 factor (ECF subfamily)